MPRTLPLATAVTVLVALTPACAPPEEQVLETFFTAVQSGNESVRASVSLDPFPGEVRSWEITMIGPESTAPFAREEMEQELLAARGAAKRAQERNDVFLRDNESLYVDYKARIDEDPEYEFQGRLAEFQSEWEPRLEEQRELEARAEELGAEFETLRAAARLSINTPNLSDGFQGDVATKEVHVKVDDGSEEKVYAAVLEKYSLVETEQNITPIARWVIREIREPGESAADLASASDSPEP